jgi:hypothetical protein
LAGGLFADSLFPQDSEFTIAKDTGTGRTHDPVAD